MRRPIFAASIAAAALIPSLAYAQSNCERQRSSRVVATVAGALGGASGVLTGPVSGGGIGTSILEAQVRTLHVEIYPLLTTEERKDLANRSKASPGKRRSSPAGNAPLRAVFVLATPAALRRYGPRQPRFAAGSKSG